MGDPTQAYTQTGLFLLVLSFVLAIIFILYFRFQIKHHLPICPCGHSKTQVVVVDVETGARANDSNCSGDCSLCEEEDERNLNVYAWLNSQRRKSISDGCLYQGPQGS